MNRFALAAFPLALVLAGCQTPYDDPYGASGYPEPYPAPYPGPYPEPYPAPTIGGDYRAVGTEPFWDLTIGRDLVFTDRGSGVNIVQSAPAPINAAAGPIYRTQRLEVTITRGVGCSDGMSDRAFPDRVQVIADGRFYRGCGGGSDTMAPSGPPPVATGPAPPLDRTRWRVTAINGRPVPPTEDYRLEFDAGRLSAKFGCNGIGAGYSQTGATLDAGAIIATKMACPDMNWENQGIAILDRVMQVSALGSDRMTLTSSAGTIELLRR